MIFDKWPWKPDPDYTRLEQALRRQGDPTRVPFLELFADQEFIAAALDEPVFRYDVSGAEHEVMAAQVEQKIRFWYGLGYDALWLGPAVAMSWPDQEADDTADKPRDQRNWRDEKVGLITSWEDFERYPWPRPEEIDYSPLEYAAEHLPEGMAIIAASMGVMEPVTWLMGYESLAMAIYEQPDLVQAMFDKIAEIFVPIARNLVQMDRVMALWMGDDMGFKTGTMVAPRHLRDYVFPIQKQIAQVAHAQGMPFVLHSCGNLEAVMDDLIDDVGIDAKHSYEDAIMPVEQVSAKYSDRIGVVGGIDMDLLTRGTEEQIRERTRHALETCAPTRAYVLGSGNSIANYIPVRNFLAMVDEGWRFNTAGA